MKKCLIAAAALLLVILECFPALADSLVTCTIQYGKPVNVSLYKITEADGTKTAAFEGLTDAKDLGQIETYISYADIVPDKVLASDSAGQLIFQHESNEAWYAAKSVWIGKKTETIYTDFLLNLNTDTEVSPKSETKALPEPNPKTKIILLWNDTGNEDKRPDKADVNIWMDDDIFQTISLTADQNWQWQLSSQEQTAVIVPEDIPYYDVDTLETEEGLFIIHAVYNPDKQNVFKAASIFTQVQGSAPTVFVNLYKDGNYHSTVSLDTTNNWNWQWKDGGQWTAQVQPVAKYTTKTYVLPMENDADTWLFVHTPAPTETYTVKVLFDDGGLEQFRPQSLALTVKDGEEETIQLNRDNSWTYSGQNTADVVFLLEEVPGFETTKTGSGTETIYVLKPKTKTLTASIFWQGQDVPKQAEVVLTHKGEKTSYILSAENNWTISTVVLDDGSGYAFSQTPIADWTVEAKEEDGFFTFINRKNTKEKTEQTVRAIWNGANKPKQIVVHAYVHDKKIQTIYLNDANGWTYTDSYPEGVAFVPEDVDSAHMTRQSADNVHLFVFTAKTVISQVDTSLKTAGLAWAGLAAASLIGFFWLRRK